MSSYNQRRAGYGASALKEYLKIKGESYNEPDVEDDTTDFLTDILHFALTKGFDVSDLIARAQMNVTQETSDPDLNQDEEDNEQA